MKNFTLTLVLFFSILFSNNALAADCVASATGDAQTVFDAVTTSALPTVTSATANFQPGDVGKTFWCTSSATAVIALGTIVSRASSTSVDASVNASGSTTGSQCVWGTGDQTSAITSAITSCTGAATSTYPGGPLLGTAAGRVIIPKGGHIISSRLLLNTTSGPAISIIGSGRQQTILFLTPTLNPSPGSGAFLIQTQGTGMRLADFGIEGANFLYTGADDLIKLSVTVRTTVENIEIRNVGITNKDSSIFNFAGMAYGQASHIFIQTSPQGSKATACRVNAAGSTFRDVSCSNHYTNLIVENGNGRSETSAILSWFGGMIDECGHPTLACAQLLAGAELDAYGLTFFGTSHGSLSIASTAVAYLNNTNIGTFSSQNRGPGLIIYGGGKAVVSQSTIRGNAGGRPVINNGTFIDGGGNDYKNCVSGCTPLSVGQAFQGKAPIKQ